MLTFFAFSSIAQSENIKKIMDNLETRLEIYNNIMNDHERMVEFMEIANGNEHTTMMMQNKKHQIMNSQKDVSEMNCNHQMMDSLNTTGKKKDNAGMNKEMMDKCSKNSDMHNMVEMMARNPKMMKLCMEKMKENGLMGEKDQLIKMKTEQPADQQEHELHH